MDRPPLSAKRSKRWKRKVRVSRGAGAHDGAVLTARFNRNGDYFFTGGKDKFLRIWRTSDCSLFGNYGDHADEVRDICVTEDDTVLCSCDGGGKLIFFDFSTGKIIRAFTADDNGVNGIQFNEFGTVIVSADSCVRLWDIRAPSVQPIQSFGTFEDSVTSVYVRGPKIYAGSLDRTVQTFDLRNNKGLSHGLGSPVKCISMGNKDTCVLASLGSTFQLLHAKTEFMSAVTTYSGHTFWSSKLGCCFTNDTTHVVGGSEDGCILIWGLVTSSVVKELYAHSAPVTCVDYHPTESCMISAAMDGSVVRWKGSM